MAAKQSQSELTLRNSQIAIAFDGNTFTRIVARVHGREVPIGPFVASETIRVDGHTLDRFALRSHRESAITSFGTGRRLTVSGVSGTIEKLVTVDSYPQFPCTLLVRARYTNHGQEPVAVEAWTNEAYSIEAGHNPGSPAFWSLQSGSYEKRPDWVVPLNAGFKQDNYLGMNADDYGGGTPVVDVWRRDVGIAVGHAELSPELVSEPITMPDAAHATLAVTYARPRVLQPGASFETLQTFVSVHTGDYFHSLREYRRLMMAKGVHFETASPNGFAPIWCAWGFGRKFRPEQIENALPEARKLGFGWVTVDDGWQITEGDWQPNPTKFPDGDASMRALVGKIHAAGMKAQLWWAPLAVHPSSTLMREHPDWLLLDQDGKKRKISWWDSYYLCPADPDVVRYHQRLAQHIIKDWGFDGLKMDGQFLNAVPPCTNPAHHHSSGLASVQQLPYFFKAISDAAHNANPEALLELCPCGTSYSFFSMPYYNMTVASDPESSWQVRSKGKTLKALMGDDLPFFGDHVELSDGGMDFASTVGVGGVIGTEYRWPPNDASAPAATDGHTAKLILTPAKEQIWDKWVHIYRENMLSRGRYLGELYDIGFDKPETHTIGKDDALYYAFYAPEWNGSVHFRGLQEGAYSVTNYVNGTHLGTIHGPTGELHVDFKQSLLVVARPISK